ncbi:Bug family tripartite tricarboxylate transporter substrate binding protein [Ottowia thiooxydans]|uniref:Bug family tripartite tricarboxylate transporter substrate binding protein n=1 Tax=Ottowia thiooxydans TaxID=219182 RepID=UPI0004085A34|nr:tripartite tricarboxylate transporter substrate binding protein [Ottowia thiooxydans]
MFSSSKAPRPLTRRDLLQRAAAGAVVVGAPASVFAQEAWPQRPVTMMVANAAGAPVDVAIRLVAKELEAKWGQAVVIDNRVGGSGLVALRTLARAKPDGYTFGTLFGAIYTTLPFAVEQMEMDPLTALDAVSLVARTPFVYMVAKESPLQTWQDYVKLARQKDTTVGSYSVGTAFHLTWAQTAHAAGIKAVYAASPTAGKTQMDLIGGLLDIALDAPSSAKGLIETGRVRALAVTSSKRLPMLPDVPTLAEQGLPGFSSDPWFAMAAPKGAPAAILAKVQQDLKEVMQHASLRERLEGMAMVPVASTAAQMRSVIEGDRKVIEPLVKQLGIRM